MDKKPVLILIITIIAILFLTINSGLACSGYRCSRYPYSTTGYQSVFSAIKSTYNIKWQESCSQYVIRIPRITVTGGIRYTPRICQRISIAWA